LVEETLNGFALGLILVFGELFEEEGFRFFGLPHLRFGAPDPVRAGDGGLMFGVLLDELLEHAGEPFPFVRLLHLLARLEDRINEHFIRGGSFVASFVRIRSLLVLVLSG
jgi:hypothetical protein